MEKDELSNVDIALFALFSLGGATKKIHTEYVAWKAYQLAPERFSWRLQEFRDRGFPDKTPVRFSLEQAKKKSHGSLVKGRAGGDAGGNESEGWILTTKGIDWLRQNEPRISELLKVKKSASLHPREVTRFLRKIKREIAFNIYLKDGNLDNVSLYMITDLLGCTPDASKKIISDKFDRYFNTAKICGDKRVINFLTEFKEKYSSFID
jgi:hypothetical protein